MRVTLRRPIHAIRRAAHFAHFNDEGQDAPSGGRNTSSSVHVGSNEARNLGPWSSAVELVNARQQAQAEREDRIKAGGSAAAQDEEEGESVT